MTTVVHGLMMIIVGLLLELVEKQGYGSWKDIKLDGVVGGLRGTTQENQEQTESEFSSDKRWSLRMERGKGIS